jgi:hypothetical protein
VLSSRGDLLGFDKVVGDEDRRVSKWRFVRF